MSRVRVDKTIEVSILDPRGKIIGTLSPRDIRYSHNHFAMGEGIYGVGESLHHGQKVWIYSDGTSQWAELTMSPQSPR